jgi:NADPH2:quinone reductase
MRAIFMRGAGGPEVLELRDTTVPKIGSGQILIEVAAAGVNRLDIAQRKGLYPRSKGREPHSRTGSVGYSFSEGCRCHHI